MRQTSYMRMRPPSRSCPRDQHGYILLTLMLVVSILAIAALAIAPSVTFQVQRDREEELIHRGVQYSRAVRKYFKQFGRYPMRIEDLESTNNMRFLRKRYKDPISGQDFKLLHFGEVQMTMGGGIAGATPAAAMPGASAPGLGSSGNGAGGAQGFSLGSATTANAGQAQSGPGTSSVNGGTTSGSAADQPSTGNGDQLSSKVFGGGPIVGVVSASKAESIREFNNKNHYNQWQFIYDPGTDRGGLLNTPAQPPLQGAVPIQPGVPGAPAAGGVGTGFGGNTTSGSGMGSFGSQPAPQSPQPAQPQQ